MPALVRVACPVGAELPERRFVDRVSAGERRRVRPSRLCAHPGHPDLLEHHRLAAGARRPEGAHERVPIGDALGVGHDHGHVVLLGQPAEHLRHRDVRLVARRYPVADVDVALAGQQRQVAAVGPALADERHAPRCGKAVLERRAERGEEAQLRVVDAEAVGTDDAQAGLCRDLAQPPLQPSTLGAHLREAGAVDDRDLHAARRARFDRFHHARRGYRYDRKVDGFRHVGDVRKRRESLHVLVPGIDGVDPAGVTRGAQVSNGPSADARGVVRGADHGDRRGAQQGVERFGRGPRGSRFHPANHGRTPREASILACRIRTIRIPSSFCM